MEERLNVILVIDVRIVLESCRNEEVIGDGSVHSGNESTPDPFMIDIPGIRSRATFRSRMCAASRCGNRPLQLVWPSARGVRLRPRRLLPHYSTHAAQFDLVALAFHLAVIELDLRAPRD